MFPNSSAEMQAITYFGKEVLWVLAAVVGAAESQRSSQLLALRPLFNFGAALVGAGIVLTLGGVSLIGGVLSFKSMIGMPLTALIIAPAIASPRDLEFPLRKPLGSCASGWHFLARPNLLHPHHTS